MASNPDIVVIAFNAELIEDEVDRQGKAPGFAPMRRGDGSPGSARHSPMTEQELR
jgi:hypothetical protein